MTLAYSNMLAKGAWPEYFHRRMIPIVWGMNPISSSVVASLPRKELLKAK